MYGEKNKKYSYTDYITQHTNSFLKSILESTKNLEFSKRWQNRRVQTSLSSITCCRHNQRCNQGARIKFRVNSSERSSKKSVSTSLPLFAGYRQSKPEQEGIQLGRQPITRQHMCSSASTCKAGCHDWSGEIPPAGSGLQSESVRHPWYSKAVLLPHSEV